MAGDHIFDVRYSYFVSPCPLGHLQFHSSMYHKSWFCQTLRKRSRPMA
jgi:hypothetical protein